MYKDEPRSQQATCVSPDCPSGKRNRFFRGKQMKAEEFTLEQRYFISRRRLVNRAVLGWGVVQGLALDGPRKAPESMPAAAELRVGPGFALDRHGQEIILIESTALTSKNTFVLANSEAGCRPMPMDKLEPGPYVLAVHYAERRIGDAHLPEGCGCEKLEKNFVCETAVFSLRRIDSGCPCAEERCERSCECGADSSCDDRRSRHSCLCQWVANGKLLGEETLCEWNGHWISVQDCVDLACVTVVKTEDQCCPLAISSIDDDCGPRRLVKSNDLLYDLARGCDLVHIDWISWEAWHRAKEPIAWEDFAAHFHADASPDGTTDFVVRFSGPVLVDTLRPDVFVVTVLTVEQSTGWRVVRRVPVSELDVTPDASHGSTLPPGTTNQMRLKVKAKWIRDELQKDEESWLSDREFGVEIEIRGDFILDCHGQAVDANAIGTKATPSGNGVPGDTFISCFRVLPKPSDYSRA